MEASLIDQQPVPQNCETAPEFVAMRMTEMVLIHMEDMSWDLITREKYLDTYAECLEAVCGKRFAAAAQAQLKTSLLSALG